MFGLFSNKKTIKVTDSVWKSDAIKFRKAAELIRKSGSITLVYYFNESKSAMLKTLEDAAMDYSEETHSQSKIVVLQARQLLQASGDLSGRTICFIEHHPSFKKEEEVMNHLLNQRQVKEVFFYISLEEPLLKAFGGERMVQILEKMGFNEDEAIQHDMISRSIVNAQRKIDEKSSFPADASSAKSWFELNVPES